MLTKKTYIDFKSCFWNTLWDVFCWVFHNRIFTYVITEVNYTEEVDDPVDSDGGQNSHHPACIVALNIFIVEAVCFNLLGINGFSFFFLQVRFWVSRIWCSASLSLSTRCWRTTSSRAPWRKRCPSSSTTSSCTCRSPRTRWGVTSSHEVKLGVW